VFRLSGWLKDHFPQAMAVHNHSAGAAAVHPQPHKSAPGEGPGEGEGAGFSGSSVRNLKLKQLDVASAGDTAAGGGGL
jgi:hypothetical protein